MPPYASYNNINGIFSTSLILNELTVFMCGTKRDTSQYPIINDDRNFEMAEILYFLLVKII
jgi:hypothetical protein